MYYRIAIRWEGDQLNQPPSWQWKSMVLSSLQALFQILRLYGPLPQDHLRVFSSSSRGSLEEQLAQENKGLSSHSVTAAQFLQQRMILSPEGTWGTPKRGAQTHQETTAVSPRLSTGLQLRMKNILDMKVSARNRFANGIVSRVQQLSSPYNGE